ncbi:OCRE domain-containing protein [Natronorarus salvus]|uniref:OCRE domain-containing protein n=1 Tax=Natronorarus salvus TaxID=3117733 RepID=UPI002F262F7E
MSEEVLDLLDELLSELNGESEISATRAASDTEQVATGIVEGGSEYGYDEYGYDFTPEDEYGYDESALDPDSDVGSETPYANEGSGSEDASDISSESDEELSEGASDAFSGWEYDASTGVYSDPVSSHSYDSTTGIFFNTETGEGFDPATGMLYDPSVGWYGGWDIYDGGTEYYWTDPTYPGAPDSYDWSGATTGAEYYTDPYSYDYTVDWASGDAFVGPESVWYGYDTPYYGDYASISEMTGETPADTQAYEALIYEHGFENVPGILSDSPIGMYEGMYGPVTPIYPGGGTSGPAAASWDIFDYYGDGWYGGAPIEHDYSNTYPDYFGPGSMGQTDPTLFPDSYEIWSPYTSTF